MATTERELKELNFALDILRRHADQDGFIEGSPVGLIYDHRGETNISLSRIRNLVWTLGILGWRETAWGGPKSNIYGTKVVMGEMPITDLKVLPAKVERKEFETKVAAWFRGRLPEILGSWTIQNPEESTSIVVKGYRSVYPRGRESHRVFTIAKSEPLPDWLEQDILNPDGTISDSTLYTLWKSSSATPDGRF